MSTLEMNGIKRNKIEQLFVLKNLREIPVDYDFSSEVTIPCRIKKGWGTSQKKAGKLGQYFGNVLANGTSWSIVLFHGEEDLQCFITEGLEFLTMKWI